MPFRFETAGERWEDWQDELVKQEGDDPNNRIHQLVSELTKIDYELRAGLQTLRDNPNVGEDYKNYVRKLEVREEELVKELEELGGF